MMRLPMIGVSFLAYAGVVLALARMAGSKWHPDGGTSDAGFGDRALGLGLAPVTLPGQFPDIGGTSDEAVHGTDRHPDGDALQVRDAVVGSVDPGPGLSIGEGDLATVGVGPS